MRVHDEVLGVLSIPLPEHAAILTSALRDLERLGYVKIANASSVTGAAGAGKSRVVRSCAYLLIEDVRGSSESPPSPE